MPREKGVDLTVDRIAGYAHFQKVFPGNRNGYGNGNRTELEIWTVSDGNGLQVLRFTDNFRALHKDLFDDAGD